MNRESPLDDRSLIPLGWRGTWREASGTAPLGLTLEKPDQGRVGVADFIAGSYPACSEHGAMNKVASHSEVWRCLNCNVGADFTAYQPPPPLPPETRKPR